MKQFSHFTTAFLAAISFCTTSNSRAQALEPFLYRATVEPYRIHELPDFMIHSRAPSDIIIQRGVFTPGVGAWHTHPGVSFAYVLQGQIKLQMFSKKEGCSETPVYGPGDVYIKPPNELHRAVVVSATNEVELIVRLDYPPGAAISSPAADPGCPLPTPTLVSQAVAFDSLAQSRNPLADFIAQQVEPFMFRATLPPFKIHDLPNFMIHSKEPTDILFQRSVFRPGVGAWHTHPGLSFAYVLQGQIKLQKFTEKDGCFETPVYGPGQIYIKPPNEIHRAVVVSAEDEVELIVRIGYPVGAPISTPAPDPGC
jgi:quercetin dioxygenase-like cupin family protein